jgi:hypothetical protein
VSVPRLPQNHTAFIQPVDRRATESSAVALLVPQYAATLGARYELYRVLEYAFTPADSELEPGDLLVVDPEQTDRASVAALGGFMIFAGRDGHARTVAEVVECEEPLVLDAEAVGTVVAAVRCLSYERPPVRHLALVRSA